MGPNFYIFAPSLGLPISNARVGSSSSTAEKKAVRRDGGRLLIVYSSLYLATEIVAGSYISSLVRQTLRDSKPICMSYDDVIFANQEVISISYLQKFDMTFRRHLTSLNFLFCEFQNMAYFEQFVHSRVEKNN